MNLSNEMLQGLRQDYRSATLNENEILKDPYKQFGAWFQNAVDARLYEPNAMTLATADKSGKPSARIVLLKGFDDNGFSFFSNYLSRKGKELKRNPFASVVFFWPELERQVRIEGKIDKLDKESSEKYFRVRPPASQVSAVISPQSQVIDGRAFLEEKAAKLTEESAGREIAKPAHWGGYVLKPSHFEFWQGRESRLHDRLTFSQKGSGWLIERLAP